VTASTALTAPTSTREVPAAGVVSLDSTTCYRAVESRDVRFDGRFIVGVTTTGIYCRPSCPAPVRPKATNVRFFATTAAAQGAGFRSCKRCRPDAVPGSPEWDRRGDLVGRAVRLIDDGTIDAEGVDGLAARLAVSPRHLHRLLCAELGASPLALARARRAQTARILIETTSLPFSEVAFAAGFASIRQFNDTVREVYAASPTELRKARAEVSRTTGRLTIRLPFRQPLAAAELVGWFAARAVGGVVEVDVERSIVGRTLALPGGPGRVALRLRRDHVEAAFELSALRDLSMAVARCRRLLDLDSDPMAIDRHLGSDPVLAPLVRARPGLRVAGSAEPHETAMLTVIGQQISTAAARTIATRLVDRLAGGLPGLGQPGPTRVFPPAAAVADADLDGLGMPRRRAATLRTLARALSDGTLTLDVGCDRVEARRRLLGLPGIGPWTVDYVLLRALGDPDAWPGTDLVLRQRLAQRSGGGDPERWRPWRSYAAQHLWAAPALMDGSTDEELR
jgi:AraC family transcriptional regulator, regulatory protein of adaptative response / DNA-3-methyladenine glycosylase II